MFADPISSEIRLCPIGTNDMSNYKKSKIKRVLITTHPTTKSLHQKKNKLIFNKTKTINRANKSTSRIKQNLGIREPLTLHRDERDLFFFCVCLLLG